MINLFEYQNKEEVTEDFEGLEVFLDDIWRQREKNQYFAQDDEDGSKIESQQFLQFLHKTVEIKSNKYVGVIHYEEQKINLLPKIFFNEDREYDQSDLLAIQQHILWWLSYCRKIKFPNYQTSLDTEKSDFFEVLIYLFAKYTRELLGHSIYQQYEEVWREVQYVRGRLDITRYVTENLSKARWHKVNCIYDPFVLDNRFNQIIKYVTSILINHTTNDDSKKYLREILFTLDDVSDEPATADECAAIQFNPAFAEFETVRDYCQLFLNHAVSFDYKNDLKLFAFLIPMEYLFEDFIYGFIEKEMDGVKAVPQSSSVYLDEDKTFFLRPDLILDTGEKKIIADTKYKMVYQDPKDPKKGISQSDLYQVLAYAVRYKIDEILLLYPDTIDGWQQEASGFIIRDEFADQVDVKVMAYQLSVINRDIFLRKINRASYKELFLNTRLHLIEELKLMFHVSH
ncbi:McrC family protein [Rhodohalobacter sp. 614A]|uniref:McrC family protein n=1 Tax=Rhodohalobacter sp. 614A TaxID=2908649 RepID=UPI001F2D7611|nr:McrC family protein [Rhodohalobacter sp. 614A]